MRISEGDGPGGTPVTLPVARPFLRWAGGKRWMAEWLTKIIPSDFGTYYEPFLGGGAVFFKLDPERAVLSDLNSDLISTYRCVRDRPEELTENLQQLVFDGETYQVVRRSQPRSDIGRAARLIFLNLTSWNGLYRVNSKGEFNVPLGTIRAFGEREAMILLAASKSLQGVDLAHSDFQAVLKSVREGDLVYLDPPYTVTHGNNGFLLYNERIFSWEDQQRLAKEALRLTAAGAHVVVSNASHPTIRELYSGFGCRQVSRSSILAADPTLRRRVDELLFTSFS